MKKHLFIIIYFLTPLSLFSKDIVKTGIYHFQSMIQSMFYEPYLRVKFSPNLNRKLFLIRVFQYQHENLFLSKKSSDEDKIEYYSQKNKLKVLKDVYLKQTLNERQSKEVKKRIIIGLTLAKQYNGYNLILKNSPDILYHDTDFNKQAAKSIAFYFEKIKQEKLN